MGNELTMRLPMITTKVTEGTLVMSPPWKRSPSTSWTMLLNASDKRNSQSSKPYPTSSQFSTSTHLGPSERRTQQSNTIHTHSMRLKPSLLQRLGEENMPNEDYSLLENPTLDQSIQERREMTRQWTNSYRNSVMTPEAIRDRARKTSLMTTTPASVISTSMGFNPTRNEESLSPRCLGSLEKKKQGELETRSVNSHTEPWPYSPEIPKPSSNGSRPLEPRLLDSPALSGTMSFEDKPLILTLCSRHCTMYPLLKRTLDAWDRLKSPLVDLSQPRRSK